MKAANVLESGLKGAGTVTLLQEIFHEINTRFKKPLKNEQAIMRKIKKYSGKTGSKAKKFYIKLVHKILTNTAYFGVAGIGKKKNALVRGSLLGAAAGLFSAFKKKDDGATVSHDSDTTSQMGNKALTVALYTLGGLAAGAVIRKINSNKKIARWLKKRKKTLFTNFS